MMYLLGEIYVKYMSDKIFGPLQTKHCYNIFTHQERCKTGRMNQDICSPVKLIFKWHDQMMLVMLPSKIFKSSWFKNLKILIKNGHFNNLPKTFCTKIWLWRAVLLTPEDPGLNPANSKIDWVFNYFQLLRKGENKEKEARNGPLLKECDNIALHR